MPLSRNEAFDLIKKIDDKKHLLDKRKNANKQDTTKSFPKLREKFYQHFKETR